MGQTGQTTFESTLIGITAGVVVLLALAGFKTVCPTQYSQTAAAFSDVSRDLAWQAQDYVAEWRSGEAWSKVAAPLDDTAHPSGGTVLRPATDPLKDIRALGR